MKSKPRVPSVKLKSARPPVPSKDQGSYQFKVELEGSKPLIWRRIRVPGDFSLAALHVILQDAMGWENCHMHEFRIGNAGYGSVAEGDDLFAQGMKSDRGARLRDVLPPGKRTFRYIYDFGDDWVHKITVEEVLSPEAGAPPVLCLAGERACPPEDCGGLYGYFDYLEILKNPGHSEYEEIKDWLGRHDPERFDLDRVNTRLKRLAK